MTDAYPGLPSKIRIGYLDYEISVFTGVESMTGGRLGEHNSAAGTIKITAGMAKAEAANTLLHEVTHAIWNIFNVADCRKGPYEKQELTEEQVVYTSTNGLLCVMRDNPELFAWLQAQMK